MRPHDWVSFAERARKEQIAAILRADWEDVHDPMNQALAVIAAIDKDKS